MQDKRELRSIFTSLPILPAIASQYDPQTSTLPERESTLQLSRLIQQGPTDYVLKQILLEEREHQDYKRRNRERYDTKGEGDSGSDGRPNQRQRRGKRTKLTTTRGWSSTGAEVGDDEKTEFACSSEGGGTRKRGKGKGKRSQQRHGADVPRLERESPRSDLPRHFPSGSLLSSLHLYASHLFTSTHALLPPLTTETPLLPPHLLTHFNQVSTSLNAQEEILLRRAPELSLKQLGKVRENRLGKIGRGSRNHAWDNVEKKFNPSALVAMGMLTKLLVEDSLQPPRIEVSQHSPPPPPSPVHSATTESVITASSIEPNLAFELPIPPPQFSTASTSETSAL